MYAFLSLIATSFTLRCSGASWYSNMYFTIVSNLPWLMLLHDNEFDHNFIHIHALLFQLVLNPSCVLEDEENLKVLPECNHAYHSECVDKWLNSQSSCPLCRASLSPIITP
ncbi:putative RING-H2 finger protein ATL50 [Durio zibethinus]|uniref:RING-H2 finger protein ATL50 n=1 Tax=Durio zibethinus TaxID=66656 RepID=A0A6P5ZMQ9_DURZI|nr:putative RING-H2 finger protein ATL50 [Durio zibethinus]